MAYIQRALVDNDRSLRKRPAPNDNVLATNPSYYTSVEQLLQYNAVFVNLEASVLGENNELTVTPIQPASTYPTVDEVATWVNQNLSSQKVEVQYGSLFYWVGTGTIDNPDYIYMAVKDISDINTSLPKYYKIIKTPAGMSEGTINIYNSNGTISSNRTIETGTKTFTIKGTGLMSFGDTNSKVEINNQLHSVQVTGDVELKSYLQGVVLIAPDSTKWRVIVTDGGILKTEPI